jgi:ATP-dependent Clp protease adaptor protein ClpS
MAEEKKDVKSAEPPADAPAKPAKGKGTATKPAPAKPQRKNLPPWKVLLHNDDENSFDHVIETIVMLTTLNEQEATLRASEAHHQGLSLLLTTHRERAELYQQQFGSRSLTVTIEQAE